MSLAYDRTTGFRMITEVKPGRVGWQLGVPHGMGGSVGIPRVVNLHLTGF